MESGFATGESPLEDGSPNRYSALAGSGEAERSEIRNDFSVHGHAGKGPKNYRRSDQRIYEDVCETLMAHPEIDASDIEVKVENGLVTLTGSVDSRFSKLTAEFIVGRLRGVDDVVNLLRVDKSRERSVDASMSGQDDLLLKPRDLEGAP